MEQIIQVLTWDKILTLFQTAKKRIVLIIPLIHEEWVTAIQEFKQNKNMEVWVCTDNQEEVFRSSYGDVKAIEKLIEKHFYIKQATDLRLSFLRVRPPTPTQTRKRYFVERSG